MMSLNSFFTITVSDNSDENDETNHNKIGRNQVDTRKRARTNPERETRNAKQQGTGNNLLGPDSEATMSSELATVVPGTPGKGLGRNPTLSTDEHDEVRKDPERTDKTRKHFVECPRPKEARQTQSNADGDDRQADNADAERRNQYKASPF
jgi:hypothetical protein